MNELSLLYETYQKDIADIVKSNLSCGGCGGYDDCVEERYEDTFYSFLKDCPMDVLNREVIQYYMLEYLYKIIDRYVQYMSQFHVDNDLRAFKPNDRDVQFMQEWESYKKRRVTRI